MNDLSHPGAVSSYYDDSLQASTHVLHDDLDQMLLHVDFPKLIEMAARVKKARQALLNGPPYPRDIQSPPSPQQVEHAVSRLQEQLLSRPIFPGSSVERGMDPIIDCTIDEALTTLTSEWDHLSKWIEQGSVSDSKPKAVNANNKKRGRVKKEAIAVKYSKWQTDILMKWMIENRDQPFPDQDAIEDLMKRTALAQTQVINWTTNVRKRNRKATCEGGKKPHHFIDFLFLVQDREEREREAGSAPTIQRSATFPRSSRESKVASRKTRSSSNEATNKAPSRAAPKSLRAATSNQQKSGISSIFRRTSDPKPTPTKSTKGRSRGRSIQKSASFSESTDAEHLMEPLPLRRDTAPDESVLINFANAWLSKSHPGEGILPTVTLDSTDAIHNMAPSCNNRIFDFDEMDLNFTAGDCFSWGLDIDCTPMEV